MRAVRYLPSVVIATLTFGVAACAPPLPPFQGPTPVPIPWVAPTQECQHWKLPGWRYTLVVPQRGVWSFDWKDSLGNFHTAIPFFYEAGQTMTIETPFTFHVTWAPSAEQGTRWYVVSPDFVPQQTPYDICPDF